MKHILQNAQKDAPNTYNFQRLTLSRSTPLFSSGRILYSESGVPQGCPLGPLGFSLGIQPIIRHISTHMGLMWNVWYLHDGVLVGDPKNWVWHCNTWS